MYVPAHGMHSIFDFWLISYKIYILRIGFRHFGYISFAQNEILYELKLCLSFIFASDGFDKTH